MQDRWEGPLHLATGEVLSIPKKYGGRERLMNELDLRQAVF